MFWCYLADIGDDGHALHQPVKLFLRNIHRFLRVSGPAKVSICQPLIQQQIAIALKDQTFDSVGPGSAEQKQYILLCGLKMILALNDCGQTINSFSEITSAADNDDLVEPFRIIQQSPSILPTAAANFRTLHCLAPT